VRFLSKVAILATQWAALAKPALSRFGPAGSVQASEPKKPLLHPVKFLALVFGQVRPGYPGRLCRHQLDIG
jgi:hypothetical protein